MDIDIDDIDEIDETIGCEEFDFECDFENYNFDEFNPYSEAEALRVEALLDQLEMEIAEQLNNADNFLHIKNQLDTLTRYRG
jgi:hypothetical protein